MVVWGGSSSDGRFSNIGNRYDPVTNLWTNMAFDNSFHSKGASGVWTGSVMLVWGGVVSDTGYPLSNAGGAYVSNLDTDGDGVCDLEDNCAHDANADQLDADSD